MNWMKKPRTGTAKSPGMPGGIEELLCQLFLESFEKPPETLVLDFDATDIPIHGEQQRRFFHGYYDHYCYLPLYVFL